VGGIVQAMPMVTSLTSMRSSCGHGSLRAPLDFAARRPVAIRQRLRAVAASSFAASPSTAIITSWNGGYGFVLEGAARIVRRCGRASPSAIGEVEPAREGHLVVEHDDLLVVGACQRMGVVEAEADVAVRLPVRPKSGEYSRSVP
jgi:hypothetical protein